MIDMIRQLEYIGRLGMSSYTVMYTWKFLTKTTFWWYDNHN